MSTVDEGSRVAGERLEQGDFAAHQSRRRPRVSRIAGGAAAALLLAMLFAYALSMSAGGMSHTMSNAALPVDGTATDPAAASTGGQMVMADGSTMDMGDHPADTAGSAATEPGNTASEPTGGDHQMVMGGSINWYVIGGILALIAAGIALASGLNEHLERRIATGALVMEGACSE